MLPERRAFYVQGDDGQNYGPVELDELREWVRENRAGLGTAVKPDDEGAIWLPWHHYPELVALLAEAHATGASPAQSGLAVASVGKRFLALMVDCILSGILASPIIYAVLTLNLPDWENQFLAVLQQPQSPVSSTLLFYIVIDNVIMYSTLTLYMAGFHAAHGQTPAKAFLRLRVVDADGHNPSLPKALLRGLGLAVTIAITLYCLLGITSLVYACFNPRRRSFHDLFAGTQVVDAE